MGGDGEVVMVEVEVDGGGDGDGDDAGAWCAPISGGRQCGTPPVSRFE